MILSSATFPHAPTLAVKTASFTRSSSTALFFARAYPSVPEKSSTGMVLSFAIYLKEWRKQHDESPMDSKTKSVLSHALRSRRHCPRCWLTHRSPSLEFHSPGRHGPVFWRLHTRSPSRFSFSAPRPFCRRHLRRLP